jgi:hypothetical protein
MIATKNAPMAMQTALNSLHKQSRKHILEKKLPAGNNCHDNLEK